MTKDQASTVRQIVRCSGGDDLERCEMAFKNLSDEALDQQYGQSGMTCRQLRDEYRESRKRHVNLCDALDHFFANQGL